MIIKGNIPDFFQDYFKLINCYGARMRQLIFILMLLLWGCSSSPQSKVSEINLIDEHTVEYIGDTSKDNVKRLESILNKHSNKIDTLVVTSTGGEVFGGMHIGHLVHKFNLKVVVKRYCMSSCANYIVTASNDVFVSKGALLGWHGGSTQPIYSSYESETSWLSQIQGLFSYADDKKEMNTYLLRWQKEELEFFDTVGVNQAVTILGMMPGLKNKRDSMLFSYDKRTLQYLGLNIKFEDEKQTELSPDGIKVVQVFNITNENLDALLKLHNKKINKDT